MPGHPPDVPNADSALVEAVLANRPGAFERLVDQYQRLCWHVVDRMVRHPEDTREICQEVFLRIHRTLHQYRGDSSLKAWIARVAYSMALRHLERKRIPIDESWLDDAGDPSGPAFTDPADVEREASEAQMQRHLHAAIGQLPPLQRTLLTLYHLEELQVSEIAQVTRLPEGTIKSHLFRSRKRLRGLLEARIGVPA